MWALDTADQQRRTRAWASADGRPPEKERKKRLNSRSIAQDQSRLKSNEQQQTHPNLGVIHVAKASQSSARHQARPIRTANTQGQTYNDSAFQDVA